MSFEVLWDPAALVAFYRLSPHAAMMVDRAVIRFAERGEGHLTRVPPYYRLRAGPWDAVVTVDRAARRLTVIRIYRVRD